MKIIQALLLLFTISFNALGSRPLEIQINPCWNCLDTDKKNAQKCGGSLFLIGIMTITKRSDEILALEKLILHWKGQQIETLLGSLYRKNLGKNLIPIEENLLCDTIWNKKEQKLICKFDKPVILDAKNEFCFVLTVPDQLESTIKNGQFELSKEELPSLFFPTSERSLAFAFK